MQLNEHGDRFEIIEDVKLIEIIFKLYISKILYCHYVKCPHIYLVKYV